MVGIDKIIKQNNIINLKDVNNGITYCIRCHEEIDKYAKRFKKRSI